MHHSFLPKGPEGHIAKDCRSRLGRGGQRQGLRDRRGPDSRFSTTICYVCGGANHLAKDCKSPDNRCYACGRYGHMARDCRKSTTDSNLKLCYRCEESGHLARDCPNAPLSSKDKSEEPVSDSKMSAEPTN
ncbi:Zinc finger protein GIS2 [Zancudomyces culisetae]|uniref:Zinc finger protein GIS2 n=1 Tax=Zancudomyces culisetae TaxID=1213189 RepID=A0A1R1PMT2_ZANCU|nr:Zinc finger protein GIS2 [Zancudomyces culisetae]|eukprot:OMH82254.1 Zinc finger protein GIS2 [Zancudomyces culisetae]